MRFLKSFASLAAIAVSGLIFCRYAATSMYWCKFHRSKFLSGLRAIILFAISIFVALSIVFSEITCSCHSRSASIAAPASTVAPFHSELCRARVAAPMSLRMFSRRASSVINKRVVADGGGYSSWQMARALRITVTASRPLTKGTIFCIPACAVHIAKCDFIALTAKTSSQRNARRRSSAVRGESLQSDLLYPIAGRHGLPPVIGTPPTPFSA